MNKQLSNSNNLCIDLDGTLINSDMLLESLVYALKGNLLLIFVIPFWILKGKEFLKLRLAQNFEFDATILPFNTQLIDYIRIRKKQGDRVYLVTASNISIANKISAEMGLFDEVFASNDKINLKGNNKLKFLIEKFGEKNFDYAGDHKCDLQIFEQANLAISVGNSSFEAKSQNANPNNLHFQQSNSNIKQIIKALRVYQWVKNILIFLPMLMAHNLDSSLLINAFLAFFSFSMMASSVYLTNDLFDLDADRRHIRKKNRPFASGKLSLLYGIFLSPVFIIVSILLAIFLLPLKFLLVLLAYYFLTSAYTFLLKKIAIIDIIILAGLYTLRIIAGGLATEVVLSPWLLAFSMFLFSSLAIMKRFTEVNNLPKNQDKIIGRGYISSDSNFLLVGGIASGFIAILVFVLYLSSTQVTALYSKPILLWGILPLLLFWMLNIWFRATRGEMSDDPIVFTFKDKSSYILAILMFVLIYSASVL